MEYFLFHRPSGQTLLAFEVPDNEGLRAFGKYLGAAITSDTNLNQVGLRNHWLCETNFKHTSLRQADFTGSMLDKVDFSGCDLTEADFSRTSLRRVNFNGANLTRAKFDGATIHDISLERTILDGASYWQAGMEKGIAVIAGLEWYVYIFDAHIKIGCQMHSTDEWEEFEDAEIADMANSALAFWEVHKKDIIAMARQHQQ